MIKKFLYLLLTKSIFFLLIIFLFIIKRFILIRFGEIETRAIGHYSCSIETYLCEKDLKIHKSPKRVYDIWFQNKLVANKFLLKKWKKSLNIFSHRFLFIWVYLNEYKFGKQFLVPYRHWRNYTEIWPDVGNQYRDINNVLSKLPTHLKFTDAETKEGENFFIENNITKKPILFFARDKNYYKNFKTNSFESDIRNSSIKSHILAINEMSKNDFCVRVGSRPEYPLNINNKNFIDYSFSKYRNELNDIYIISKCKFFVSTGSGIDQVALLFRKPIVLVNATETDYRFDPIFNSLFKLYIPKKIFSKNDNRLLTFSEIFKIGTNNLLNTSDYKRQNLELVENTPEEIRDVVIEMNERMNKSWVENKEDEELQKRYWEINYFEGMPKFECRIGSKYLKDNVHLLK